MVPRSDRTRQGRRTEGEPTQSIEDHVTKQVRYHDLQGNAIMPDSVTSSDVIDNLMNDYYGNGMDLMNGMDGSFLDGWSAYS